MTSIELTPDQEKKIQWSATAERFIGKINEEIEGLKDENPRILLLDNLKSEIELMFKTYENQEKSIEEVIEDLDFRIENTEDENMKKIYTQIKLFVNVAFSFIL